MLPTDFYTWEQTQQSLSRKTVEAEVIKKLGEYGVNSIVNALINCPYIGLDVETRGFEPWRGGLHGIGLSNGDDVNLYILVENNEDSLTALINELSILVTFVGHNLKYDLRWLKHCLGIDIDRLVIQDTYLASYVLNPTGKHKLSALAGEYLGRYPYDFAELISKHQIAPLSFRKGNLYLEKTAPCPECDGKGEVKGARKLKGMKKVELFPGQDWREVYAPKKCLKCKGLGTLPDSQEVYGVDYVDLQALGDYCAEDCYEAVKLWEIFNPMLMANKLTDIYQLELELMPILLDMETRGATIDKSKLLEAEIEFTELLEFYTSEFNVISSINPASPVQVLHLLQRLFPNEDVKDTTAATLKKLKGNHPVIDILSEIKKYSKLIDFCKKLNTPDSIVRTSYGFAKTGRLTSSEPNLQNIPAKTEEGKLLRMCFVPSQPNYQIIALDYSQFEYRIIAYLSQDPLLAECFLNDIDFHGKLTALIFGEDYTKAQRTAVKSINYGLAYGMGANKLSKMLTCSLEEAKDLMNQHRELVPGIWEFLHSNRESAIVNGYTQTIWGRKRYYNFTTPEFKSLREGGKVTYSYLEYLLEGRRVHFEDMAQLRESMNHPIQGTNADAIKQAKIDVFNKVCEVYEGSNILLTVHDELVLECHERDIHEVFNTTKELMESVIDLGEIPVIVDGSVATSWGGAK